MNAATAEIAYSAVVAAPSFCLGVRCAGREITGIDFLAPGPERVAENPLAAAAAEQLRAWLADAGYRFSLPLAAAGTPFQRRVWAEIAAIAPGATRSYGEIARRLDSSPRAVGNACGANPYPVVVPCHRVLAAGGGLGGFARERGGFLLTVKRWLLDHEGRC